MLMLTIAAGPASLRGGVLFRVAVVGQCRGAILAVTKRLRPASENRQK